MKKLLLITAMFMATSAWAATYSIWYQNYDGDNWHRGSGGYADFGQCEQTRKFRYYYNSRCNAD